MVRRTFVTTNRRSQAMAMPTVLCFAACLLPPLVRAENPAVAVLAIHKPGSLAGNYAGYFATFSKFPMPKGDLSLRVPADKFGCKRYAPADRERPESSFGMVATGWVAVVFRGNCTFLQKALKAQEAGAAGIIIVSDNQEVQIMGAGNQTQQQTGVNIFVLGVDRNLGDGFVNTTKDGRGVGGVPIMSVSPYSMSPFNISEAILICLATLLVALGAFFSTADVAQNRKQTVGEESFQAALAPHEDEVLEVDQWQAIGFCVVGSCFLVFLFYFMQYMIYVIILCFCLGGASCIAQFGAICLNYFFPSLRNKGFTIPVVGGVSHAEFLAAIPAIALAVCWVPLRNTPYGWPFQDIIGAGFLCWLQRTLRLQNMKVASVLLSIMFVFDVFWVFVSPLLFHESVMVRVATGGGTGESVPMLLRIPTFGDPFGGDRLLGFGDIALPGLLVSYLRRHDLISGRTCWQGYFGPSMVGYFIGLNITFAALMIMHLGQPALLYLVPGTLGTTLVLALVRRELGLLWEGKPARLLDDMDEESSDNYRAE